MPKQIIEMPPSEVDAPYFVLQLAFQMRGSAVFAISLIKSSSQAAAMGTTVFVVNSKRHDVTAQRRRQSGSINASARRANGVSSSDGGSLLPACPAGVPMDGAICGRRANHGSSVSPLPNKLLVLRRCGDTIESNGYTGAIIGRFGVVVPSPPKSPARPGSKRLAAFAAGWCVFLTRPRWRLVNGRHALFPALVKLRAMVLMCRSALRARGAHVPPVSHRRKSLGVPAGVGP